MKEPVLILENNKECKKTALELGNRIVLSKGSQPKFLDRQPYISSCSLKYIVHGRANFEIDKHCRSLHSGQSLFVNNGMDTRLQFVHGSILSIFLTQQLLFDVHQTLKMGIHRIEYPFDEKISNVDLYDSIFRGRLIFIDRLIYNSFEIENSIKDEEFFYHLAFQILYMNNEIWQRLNHIECTNISTKKELYRRIEIAREILLSSVKGKYNLDEVSKQSCLSKFHLIRTFKEIHGITPYKFYIREKVRAAKKHFLENSHKLTLSMLAVEFKFTDYPTFSKQFKSVEGYPPSHLFELLSDRY